MKGKYLIPSNIFMNITSVSVVFFFNSVSRLSIMFVLLLQNGVLVTGREAGSDSQAQVRFGEEPEGTP